VKIRYKLPTEDVSKLITTPVTEANAVSSFDAANADQRFSIAVAAFGQKPSSYRWRALPRRFRAVTGSGNDGRDPDPGTRPLGG